jgi:L-2-hydroxyglutarate oxidase LhgO
MEQIDCVVIRAGVVGLAVARALALAGREVIVLEAAGAIGTGISSRNSEVIHAGLYYTPGSLKARLCVQGKAALYAYCIERGIGHRRCGKLIVATSPGQIDRLHAIRRSAEANGVDDLQLLSREAARALEPEIECIAALHSPGTGIVSSHELMLSLEGDICLNAGILVLNTAVAQWKWARAAIELIASDGTELRAVSVVNAAGLQAPALAARCDGLPTSQVPTAYFAKGSYFGLSGASPFTRLVYPVPEPAGLGVHLTIDLGGQARFGPDVQWVTDADDLAVDASRGDLFYDEIRRYWPGLQAGKLRPDYAGICPKISGPSEAAQDFRIQGPREHGLLGLVNLFGIESPGLTASLAIGEHVARLLEAG